MPGTYADLAYSLTWVSGYNDGPVGAKLTAAHSWFSRALGLIHGVSLQSDQPQEPRQGWAMWRQR